MKYLVLANSLYTVKKMSFNEIANYLSKDPLAEKYYRKQTAEFLKNIVNVKGIYGRFFCNPRFFICAYK